MVPSRLTDSDDAGRTRARKELAACLHHNFQDPYVKLINLLTSDRYDTIISHLCLIFWHSDVPSIDDERATFGLSSFRFFTTLFCCSD